MYCVLIDQRKRIESRINVINWSSKVRNLLQNAGFGDVWLFPDSVNFKLFIPALRTRLKDTYITQWREGMELCSSLYLFTEFKTVFERSSYLHQLHTVKYRHILALFRLSSHKLNIEIGRYNKIDRQDRRCIRCNLNDIEDEFHFVLVCPDYINLK